MIALVTDSSSQIPPDLACRFDVEVVPIPVVVEGESFREGVDLGPDEFWGRVTGRELPEVTTSQPSPGEFVAVYESLAAAGADQIVSVHVGESFSGTLNSARFAAEMVNVDVRVVDSGTASFGVTCCVWEAGVRRNDGATADEIVARIAVLGPRIGTAFIVQALDFARRGGRFDYELPTDADGVMVLAGAGDAMDVVATGRTVDELVAQMVAQFLADDQKIRVGVSLADPATIVFTEALEAQLREAPNVVEIVRYRVGPSIAAHTGPGTAGGFWCPVD